MGVVSYTREDITLLLERCRALDHLLRAHALVLKSGFARCPRLHAKLLALAALRSWGSLHHARSLFDAAPPAALPLLCDPMIRAYSRSISPLGSVPVYNLMRRSGIPPSPFTFPFLLKACSRAAAQAADCDDACLPPAVLLLGRKGCEIHCHIIRLGFEFDDLVRNSLMSVYSQCGRIQDARKLFDETTEKTVVSWNVMLAAYNRLGDYDATDELFRLMPEKNVSSWNSMITRYVRTGNIAAASRIFLGMPQRDAISWNSMIAGYIRVKSYARALDLFKQMQASNVKPTELTIVSVLGACAESSALDLGREIHFYLKKNGYRIEGYGKLCGHIYLQKSMNHKTQACASKCRQFPVSDDPNLGQKKMIRN
ncbi:hypothetical protein Cni_G29178 [Canna indica]|uniref:Pentatricopeptide repeat-containing protein n=1 Tax=Canna indica TaxID=4628 RepID=A0AAQ3L496_9LILI|nr:hypothetical protein Cni_G29178 [Canna indica]